MAMPKLATSRPPVIAAGGITAISLFVLLVCSLAVEVVIGKSPPQTRTGIPNPFTTNALFRGSDEFKSDVASTLCGDTRNHCAAFGHPV